MSEAPPPPEGRSPRFSMKRLSSPRAARPGPVSILQETDELVAECEAFIMQAKSSLAVLPFQAINEWRTRRKDEQLMSTYENIHPRLQQSEKALRDMLEQSAEKKQSLREQAKELRSKLGDCIDFNRGELEKSDPVLNQLRSVVDVVSNQSCLLYTSPSPRDRTRSRMPSSA